MEYIIYFAITIGILVFVHEFGHFAAAKLSGMRADVFAIGFGKRLLGYNKISGFTFGDLPKDFDGQGNTDYRICLLPLECSLGTNPRYAISCRGESKRLMSPSSATTDIAVTKWMPRSAINDSTTSLRICPAVRGKSPAFPRTEVVMNVAPHAALFQLSITSGSFL